MHPIGSHARQSVDQGGHVPVTAIHRLATVATIRLLVCLIPRRYPTVVGLLQFKHGA